MSLSPMATTRNSSPTEIDFPSIHNSQINGNNALIEVLSEENAVFANHQQDQILTTDPEKTARSSHHSAAAYCFQAETNYAALVEPSSIQTSISNPPNFDIEASSLPMAGGDTLEPTRKQPGDPTLANLTGRAEDTERSSTIVSLILQLSFTAISRAGKGIFQYLGHNSKVKKSFSRLYSFYMTSLGRGYKQRGSSHRLRIGDIFNNYRRPLSML
ncbi:hypothetical protein ACEPPN_006498 [Leptodophora sp. 'Broadleaf-Isolate-01']